MAERLTVRSERGTAILKETDIKDRCEYCYEATQKLAHYEDLEEQGRLIELPCKIGDMVYGIRRFHGDRIVKSGTVSEMYFNQNMELIIVIKNVCRGCWGKRIFGTLEEAEAALKGAEHDT